MPLLRLDEDPGQLVLHAQGGVCTSTREVVESAAFGRVVTLYLGHLAGHDAPLLDAVGVDAGDAAAPGEFVDLLRLLAHNPLERVVRAAPGAPRCSRGAGRSIASSRASTTSGGGSTAFSSTTPPAPRRAPPP